MALAEAYTRQGMADVALIVLEDLMRSPNPPARALLAAARLYLDDDQPQAASRAYHQAVDLDPSLADAELAARLAEFAQTPDQ